jgi:aminoglycoside phosphotransferase (APT) family kinase protein
MTRPSARTRARQAQHGATNLVLIDEQRETVIKVFTPSADRVLWRSQAREVAALRLPDLATMVPRLLSADAGTMTTARVAATPLPELLTSPRDDSADRCRLASSTGATLRRIHSARAGHIPALAWSADVGQSWWDRYWDRLLATATRVCRREADLGPVVYPALDAVERYLPPFGAPRIGLLHGDFGGANLLIRAAGAAAPQVFVVDWEWAAIGDVSYDLCRIEWLAIVGRDSRHWAGPRARAAFYEAYGAADAPAPAAISLYGCLMAFGDIVWRLASDRRPDERIVAWLKSIAGT